MRWAGGFVIASVVGVLAAGQIAAWLIYQRRLRRLSERLQARSDHRVIVAETRVAALRDELSQDFRGITLTIQGVAEHLPPENQVRHRLEAVLDRADEVLDQWRSRAREEKDFRPS